MATSVPHPSTEVQVGVYECTITLKFRLLEEDNVIANRDRMLELLIDAYAYGSDEFVEQLESRVEVSEVPEMAASPLMRRQLIRLRNLPAA
ncbi:MAG: Npun_R1517 family heterocyst differentiation transcriptional regulator [Nodosilinea sp.]